MSSSNAAQINPARRVSGQRQDVWSIINAAITASPFRAVVNMGQGSFDYNPPNFVLHAARDALERIDCNQYSPTKGRQRLKRALANMYSPSFGRKLDPEAEITITTGANEGMLSAFMAFINPGDEVIIFEPFFDQYISNIQMAGGKVVYVPLRPPPSVAMKRSSAADWTLDLPDLEKAMSERTKMLVINTPNNPIGKVFSHDELQAIGELCVKRNVVILSDEVYDKLCYVPFHRIASFSPEIARLTLTVGSVGKHFYATGWRVGFLIGPEHLIKYVSQAHTRICFVTPGPAQEAAAVGYEVAGEMNFWEKSSSETLAKMKRFNEVWDELGLPYSEPEGGYFVLVNLSKVKIPDDYKTPPHIAERSHDFELAWFLINELGVGAIPPSEFYSEKNSHLVKDFLRFGVCRTDEGLELAKERLRGLKKFMSP